MSKYDDLWLSPDVIEELKNWPIFAAGSGVFPIVHIIQGSGTYIPPEGIAQYISEYNAEYLPAPKQPLEKPKEEPKQETWRDRPPML